MRDAEMAKIIKVDHDRETTRKGGKMNEYRLYNRIMTLPHKERKVVCAACHNQYCSICHNRCPACGSKHIER